MTASATKQNLSEIRGRHCRDNRALPAAFQRCFGVKRCGLVSANSIKRRSAEHLKSVACELWCHLDCAGPEPSLTPLSMHTHH